MSIWWQADFVIFLRTSTSVPVLVIAALHPVLALAIFWLSVKLLRETGGTAAPKKAQ